jgi:ParB family chromosome partitioning protein
VVKRGLPTDVKMRHDSHYVEELTRGHRSVGRILPIQQIEPNPEQPRSEIGDLTELSGSIKQKGVLEPILVKPKPNGTWMIIAGERRWRAANLAGLTEVPCIELDLDEKSIAEIALIENLQRKDLTVWEEADGMAFLIERFNYTHEEIAKKIGKSRTTVTESMAVAGLPESIRQKCRLVNITAKTTLLEIARQFDEKAMHEFFDSAIVNGIGRDKSNHSVRTKIKEKISQDKISLNKNAGKSKNNFVYNSLDNSFLLEIKFIEKETTDTFEKSDVLKALKETFEHVKNSSKIP